MNLTSTKALSNEKKRQRPSQMHLSEIMTILIMFHLSYYKTFKDFYKQCIEKEYKKYFPKMVSYNRFIEIEQNAFMPLVIFMLIFRGKETGKYFVDSTKLPVCQNLRIPAHKVFKDFAKRGKTSTGWFFGFKLHLIINDQGEIMSFHLTAGNVDDRKPLDLLTRGLKGWLCGDKGYIGKELKEKLKSKGIELITKIKKNMRKTVLEPFQKFMLSKRSLIETIIGQLKIKFTMSHSRHRSNINFQINVLAALVAYVFMPNKSSVSFRDINGLGEKMATLDVADLEKKMMMLTSN
jgi:hypothetical protein